MEKVKNTLKKECKVCEYSFKLSQGELFIIPTKNKDLDNVFICNNCLTEIIEGEIEEE